jgi:chromosome segregation ATPase
MKFFPNLPLLLFIALVATTLAQDDCEQVCQERHDALVQEKEGLIRDRDVAVREKDELWHSREHVIKEKDEFFAAHERAAQELQAVRDELATAVRARDELQHAMDANRDEHTNLLREVEDLRKSKAKDKEDMAHYTKVAQDNQKYMQEYKNELHTQRDKANKLDLALQEANAKIEELESTTLVKIFQKEVASAWKAIVEYWVNLRKGKEGNSEF